jgi:cytochrome c oxidase subunit 2
MTRRSVSFWVWPALLSGVLFSVFQMRAANRASSGDDAIRGQQVFQNCVPCHGEVGQGNPVTGAPNIAGMNARYIEEQLQHFRNGARGASFSDEEGLRMRPIAMSLASEDDVRAVARYVATLPVVQHQSTLGGDPQAGKKRYTLCSSCHGPDGAGNEAMQAPRIAGVDDWYLYLELVKFKERVRGAEPGDTQGQAMAPMAATLPNDKAVRDVVAYISTLKPTGRQ